jgi:hypothetical protein
LFLSKIHRLRNLLTVIIGGIETNNTELAMRAIRSMQQELEGCLSCPLASDQPVRIQNSAFSTVEVSVAKR